MKKLNKLSAQRNFFTMPDGSPLTMAEMKELTKADRDELGDACLAHYQNNPAEVPAGYTI